MEKTRKPFPEAIREVLDDRGWSIRELARHTKADTGWGAVSTIHFMVNGDIPVTRNGIEKISEALRIAPEFWAEYRLMRARDELDPEQVGFQTALRHLNGNQP